MLKRYINYLAIGLNKVIQARNWSLRYGTNLAQLLNIAFCSVFIYIFGFADSAVDDAPIYSAFVPFDESRWWLVMPTIIVLQIVFMTVKSLRCDVLSGFVLIISVPVWTFVSIVFANSGFINTGTFVYGIWAFTCLMSGWRMMDLYDYKLIVKRRGKEDAKCISDRDKCTNHAPSANRNDRRIDGRLLDSAPQGEA